MDQRDQRDWFRSTTWDDATAAEFERRLARARASSRAQYIRIQGTHLVAQSRPHLRAAGRELLSRVVAEYGDDELQAKSAIEQLGASLAQEGRTEEAMTMYRRVRDLIALSTIGASGTSGLAGLALAELLIRKSDPESLSEATRLLDQDGTEIEKQGMLFRDTAVRYLVTRARLATAVGDPSASSYAARALEIANETVPSIPRHPDLGRPSLTGAERAELAAILS